MVADRAAGKRVPYDLGGARGDFPAWAGKPERSLVVCTQQRSGSTLLGEAMYHAGGMGCPLEYLHTGFRPSFEKRWGAVGFGAYVAELHRLRTGPDGTFAIKLFWRDIVEIARERAPEMFAGLDTMTPQVALDADAHRRLLEQIAPAVPDAQWVFLRRADTVRQAISHLIAWRTVHWRGLPGTSPLDEAGDFYDFATLIRLHRRILLANANWRNFFAANRLDVVEIVYEDLERDYAGTLSSLFVALGRTDASVPEPRLSKQAGALSEAMYQRFRNDFAARETRPQ